MATLRRRIGRRGAALLFFSYVDLVFGLSLIWPSAAARRSPSFVFLADVLPLWAWGALWLAAGFTCLVAAFRLRDQWGFSAAIGIKVFWGLLYAGGQVFAHVDRGYVGAVVWLAFGAFAYLLAGWPEPPSPPREVP